MSYHLKGALFNSLSLKQRNCQWTPSISAVRIRRFLFLTQKPGLGNIYLDSLVLPLILSLVTMQENRICYAEADGPLELQYIYLNYDRDIFMK